MIFKAVTGRVIAQLIKEERKTQSGLVLPEENMKDLTYWKARVIDSNDNVIKKDDVIIIGKYAGSTLVDDYVSVLVSDILGIL